MDTLTQPTAAAIAPARNTIPPAEPIRRRVAHSVQRLESVDLYRGLLMVIMLLDHTRYFVHFDGATALHDPLDVSTTTWQFYLTRWITHLCAPGFVLLAGASA